MKLFISIFSLLVALKTIDLAVRAVKVVGTPAGLALALVWCSLAVLLYLDPSRRAPAGGLTVMVVIVGLLGTKMWNQHLWLIGLIALGIAALDGPALVLYLKWQATVVYGFAAMAKFTPWFLDGSVLAGTAGNRWALVPDWGWTFLGILTVAVEAGLAVALWMPRWRRLAATVGALFHLGIVVTMASGATSLVRMIVFNGLLVALYVPFFVDAETAWKGVTGRAVERDVGRVETVERHVGRAETGDHATAGAEGVHEQRAVTSAPLFQGAPAERRRDS